jgi:hypothetical protein
LAKPVRHPACGEWKGRRLIGSRGLMDATESTVSFGAATTVENTLPRMPSFLFFIALRFFRVFIALRVTVDQRAGRSRRSTDLLTQRRMFIQSVRSHSRRADSLMGFRCHVPIHEAY